MTNAPGSVEQRIGGDPLAVTIAGVAVPSHAVAAVTITRGRTQVDQRTQPATLSATFDRDQLTALPTIGDDVIVDLSAAAIAHFGAAAGAVRRFTGRVTDATALSTGTVQLSAAGSRSRLAQLDVGGTLWPQELDGARAARILADAQLADPSLVVDSDAGTVQVLSVDVDTQKAGDLLDRLAVDSGGELAELRDGTLAWHDADHRRNQLVDVELAAAQVLAPLAWQQQLAGLLNDVTLGYGTDGGSGQATVHVADSYAADRWPAPQSISTQLVDATTASSRANELVGRFGRPRWLLPGLAVDLLRAVDGATAAGLLALDFGDLVAVTGFAAAGPFSAARLFVEGGTETITRHAWQLALAVSDYRATGPATRWVDVPADVSWADVDPSLSWLAAISWYEGDPYGGRWVDEPADLGWADVDPALTWTNA